MEKAMSKTIRREYDKHLTFIKLIEAFYRVKRNKSNKYKVINYEENLENNINNIYYLLKEEKYYPSKYHEFIIYEPKMRIIKSMPIKDRIIHQWYVEEFIKPYIVPRLISTTYACIKNRGTHQAMQKAKEYMRIKRYENSNYYVLKCDIHKYFYSVDKEILYKIMCKYIKDKKILNLTKTIIFYQDNSPKGIPIGNYTSQYFANIYLNELDQYIKHELKIKYYIRYMDDFIILTDTKEEARKYYNKIKEFLRNNLKLKLNSKSRYYPSKQGINFCGYIIHEDYVLVRKRSKKKFKKKIKKWNEEYKEGTLDKNKALLSINTWLGHISHADSYNLKKKYLDEIDFIKDEKDKK